MWLARCAHITDRMATSQVADAPERKNGGTQSFMTQNFKLRKSGRGQAYNKNLTLPERATQDLLSRLGSKANAMSAIEAAKICIGSSGHDFEELLERIERVFVIESNDVPGTLGHLDAFVRFSGKAVYRWERDRGLMSLKVSDACVPATTRFADALRYILDSQHYGIYCFSGFEDRLDLNTAQLLQQIATGTSSYERKVFLVGENVRLPSMISKLVARCVYEPARRLRLRDGRWVV